MMIGAAVEHLFAIIIYYAKIFITQLNWAVAIELLLHNLKAQVEEKI